MLLEHIAAGMSRPCTRHSSEALEHLSTQSTVLLVLKSGPCEFAYTTSFEPIEQDPEIHQDPGVGSEMDENLHNAAILSVSFDTIPRRAGAS